MFNIALCGGGSTCFFCFFFTSLTLARILPRLCRCPECLLSNVFWQVLQRLCHWRSFRLRQRLFRCRECASLWKAGEECDCESSGRELCSYSERELWSGTLADIGAGLPYLWVVLGRDGILLAHHGPTTMDMKSFCTHTL